MSDKETGTPRDDILHDRFVRWQSITREQLSYAINLVLGSSGAIIGFGITLLLNRRFTLPEAWERFAFDLSILLLALAMVPGLFAVVSRLVDFRLTTRLARLRWKSPENAIEIDRLEACSDKLGRLTWRLFWKQMALFGAGTCLMAIVLFAFVLSKLS